MPLTTPNLLTTVLHNFRMALLPVGHLAAIVNVAVLLLVAVTARIFDHTIRNFSIARLRSRKRAPLVSSTDTWLYSVPLSLLKYARYPGIWATTLCVVLVFATEGLTELGVQVNKKCGPVRNHGFVISVGDTLRSVTAVELSASSFFLQSIRFEDGELTAVRAGLPRRVASSTCLRCLPTTPEVSLNHSTTLNNTVILDSCTVDESTAYGPGALEVNVTTTNNAFKTITQAFHNPRTGTTYTGDGDLTRNNEACAMFLFSTDTHSEASVRTHARAHARARQMHIDENRDYDSDSDSDSDNDSDNDSDSDSDSGRQRALRRVDKDVLSVQYFEYANQDHCVHLLEEARGVEKNSADAGVANPGVRERTRGTVYSVHISCRSPATLATSAAVNGSGVEMKEIAGLSVESLRTILRGYRTIQLENTAHPARFRRDMENGTTDRFQALTVGDVYRAVLAMKIIDDGGSTGAYYEYVECGSYDAAYVAPLLCTLGVVTVLWVASRHTVRLAGRAIRIPQTTWGWIRHLPDGRLPLPTREDEWAGSARPHSGSEAGREEEEEGKTGCFSLTFDELVLQERDNVETVCIPRRGQGQPDGAPDDENTVPGYNHSRSLEEIGSRSPGDLWASW